MKKFIGVLISFTMLFVLSFSIAACGSGEKDSSLSSDSSSSGGGSSDSSSSGGGSSDSSSSGGEIVENRVFKILSPRGEIAPYAEDLKAYLDVYGDVNVASYCGSYSEAYAPVVIEWKNTYDNVKNYVVEYDTDENFTNAIVKEVSADSNKTSVYNLYKDTNYYVRVTANYDDDSSDSVTGSFHTTDNGPRVMKIDGIYNVRDMGGYMTSSGKKTVQGVFFRGGALSPCTYTVYDHVALTSKGKKYMSETLKIKTDFDLRNSAENLGLSESPIPGANLEYYNANGYLSVFTETETVKKVFSALADQARYPVYMHCTGGADRTGTYAFLVNALCGVDERTLIRDYEITSFSLYQERNSKTNVYQFAPFVERLKSYEGETLAEKTESFLLSVGVTETEIYNVKAIMFGEKTKELPVEPVKEKVKAFGSGSDAVELTAGQSYTGTTAFGYGDKIVEFDIGSATDDGNGGIIFMIGSYGFKARGGSFRYMTLTAGGTLTENRGSGNEINFADTFFRNGAAVALEINAINETQVKLTVYVNNSEIGSIIKDRIETEIAPEGAFAKVQLTNSVYTLKLINVKKN